MIVVMLNIFVSYPKISDKKIANSVQNKTVETTENTTKNVTLDNSIAAKGKHITVKKSDLDYYVTCAKIENNNSDTDIEKKQLEYLIKRETLFYKAKSKGFLSSKNEVSSYVKEQKELVHNADNYDDFCKYLHSIGITETNYWKEQSIQTRKDLSISNYLNSLKKKIANKNHLEFYPTYVKIVSSVENDSTTDYMKLNDLWNTYYENMVEILIKDEDVKIY